MRKTKNFHKHSSSVAGKSSWDGRGYWRDELDFDGGKRYIRRRVRRLEDRGWRREHAGEV